jgi:hypothetical protein
MHKSNRAEYIRRELLLFFVQRRDMRERERERERERGRMGKNADQAADANKAKLCKARATTVLRDSWCPGRPGPRRWMGGSCVEGGEVDRNKNHDARLLLHIVLSFSFFGSIL